MSWGIGKRIARVAAAGLALAKSAVGMRKPSDPYFRDRELEKASREDRKIRAAMEQRKGARRIYWTRSGVTPHQGAHERARRVGGASYRLAKDLNRARRGLPPIHTVRAEG